MYDVIVVGARCAGSATALLLARKGYRVLVVDRATFPSDTISGHCILHRGTVRLKRWGLLDKVIASGCPPITHWATNFGDFTLSADVPLVEDAPSGIGPRRTVLDSILLEAAAAAGAEVHQGLSVTGLLTDGDRVTGIHGRNADGREIVERAPIIVGADGKHSKIAEWVGAERYMEHPSLTCWYYTYWSGLPCDGLEIHWRHHRLAIAMPTNDNLILLAIAWPHSEFHQFRSDIEGNYLKTVELYPDLYERLKAAQREERYVGMADVPGYFRKPYGDGWALIGDAGHHKDPTPAYGISDAFCDAELLAEAIDAGLSGHQPMQTALESYEAQRNARAVPDHEYAAQSATLESWDTPDVLGIRAALRNNTIDAGYLYAVRAKALPPESFFTPDNLQRIMYQGKIQEGLSAD